MYGWYYIIIVNIYHRRIGALSRLSLPNHSLVQVVKQSLISAAPRVTNDPVEFHQSATYPARWRFSHECVCRRAKRGLDASEAEGPRRQHTGACLGQPPV